MAPRAPFVSPPGFNTPLNQLGEFAFRNWVQKNKVPFDPDVPKSDYDMRGFWQAQQQGNPMAVSGININDGRQHYPDYWKTPLHKSFSNESQWAGSDAPAWINDSQLADPNGRIVFDEHKQNINAIIDALMGVK